MSVFNSIKVRKPKKSVFNLSHDNLLTLSPGLVTPILVEEVVPGDSFKMSVEHALRCMPLKAPILGDISLDTYFFYVPYRLVWDDFDKCISDEKVGSLEVTVPQLKLTDAVLKSEMQSNWAFWQRYMYGYNSLMDYLDFPVRDIYEVLKDKDIDYFKSKTSLNLNVLPFRAYHLIYENFFMNQAIQHGIGFSTSSSDVWKWTEVKSLLGLRRGCYKNDYFTSALPYSQVGDELRLATTLSYNKDVAMNRRGVWRDFNGEIAKNRDDLFIDDTGHLVGRPYTSYGYLQYDPRDSLQVGSKGGKGISISELRKAFSLQRFLEKQARSGSRMKEVILANFGVNVADYRLDIPEFLGGYRSNVITSEVLQLSATQSDSPLGAMAGRGVSVGGMNKKHYFPEHGYLMGLTLLRPRNLYAGGLPRRYMKRNRFDFYWPDFQNIGEQVIQGQELKYNPLLDNSGNESNFGFQPRYVEYKCHNSRVHGDFLDTLAYWHNARMFDTKPELNSSFVGADLSKRIMAYQGDEFSNFLVRFNFKIKASRPMQYFSNPS